MIRELLFIVLIAQIPLWICTIFLIIRKGISFKPRQAVQSLKVYYPIIVIMVIAIILSVMRAVLVDPIIVVQDGYNRYALLMKNQIFDWTYEIDEASRGADVLVKDWSHKFRIGYSMYIALIHIITGWDYIIIGKIMSFGSFLASVYLLNKILIQTGYFNDLWHRNVVLSLYLSNVTIMTNIVRFETDVFFLALVMTCIVVYQQLLNKKGLAKLGLFLLLIFIWILLIFTREIGVILIGAMILHQIVIGGKIRKIGFVASSIAILYVAMNIQFFKDMIFYMMWSTGTYNVTDEIINKGNIIILFEYLILKFTAPNLYTKNIEAIAYAFGIVLFLILCGALTVMRNRIQRKKAISDVMTVFLFLFLSLFLLAKIGRGLDRFFMPIIFIPIMLAPQGLECISNYLIRTKFQDSNHMILQAKILASIVVMQILIFGVRMILTLLEIGIDL